MRYEREMNYNEVKPKITKNKLISGIRKFV